MGQSFYAKDCQFNPVENGRYIGFGRSHSGTKQTSDGYGYKLINCQFNGPTNSNILDYVGSAQYPVGTIQVVNFTGNISTEIIRQTELRNKVQCNLTETHGYRIFQGTGIPTDSFN